MMKRVVLKTAIRLVLAYAVFGGSAKADEDPKAIFQRGTALFALQKFPEAAIAFEKAFELRPDPAILYNAAQAHRLAGNKPRALSLYESLLKLYGSRIPNRAEIGDHVRNLKQAIAADRHATSAPPVTPLPSREGEVGIAPPESASVPPPAVVIQTGPAAMVQTAAPTKPPLTKRRWFWGVVGGAAVVVVAGVTVGVVLGTTKTVPPTPAFGVDRGN